MRRESALVKMGIFCPKSEFQYDLKNSLLGTNRDYATDT